MSELEIARNSAITDRARSLYDEDQVRLIRHTVAADCNDAELAMFLELSARYQLDPFAKQIWAIKIQGRVQIVVSRDGLLSLANRSRDFRGCQSDVVREFDYFKREFLPDGRVVVAHEYRDEHGEPTHGGKDGSGRGQIVGSWAIVSREGHRDTFCYALRSEYDKRVNVWLSHPSEMMRKCAQSIALRQAFSVSGVVGEGELEPDGSTLTRPGERPVDADFGDDPQLADDLRRAFDVLGYRHAKVRLMLRGCKTRADRVALLQDLSAEADAVDDVQDADVVPDAA